MNSQNSYKFTKQQLDGIWLIVVSLIMLIMLSHWVSGYQIIVDNDFENQTLIYCQKQNDTIGCLDYHIFLKESLTVNQTIIINNSYYNQTVINRTDEVHYNYTIIRIENHSTIIDKSNEKSEIELNHELKMAMVEKGLNPESSDVDLSQYITMETLENYVSAKLVSNLPSSSQNQGNPPNINSTGFPFSTIEIIGFFVVIGIVVFYYMKKKQKQTELFKKSDSGYVPSNARQRQVSEVDYINNGEVDLVKNVTK